jgi:hypothetical protein
LARINYRQQKQLREQGKKKRNDEKQKRKQKLPESVAASELAKPALEADRER